MSILNKIIYSGIQDSFYFQRKRGVIIANYISLLLSSLILLAYTVDLIPLLNIERLLSTGDLFKGLFIFLTPVLINRFSLTTLSRMWLCVGSMGFFWFVFVDHMMGLEVVESSVYDSLRIYLLATSAIPFLLFDKGSWPFFLIIILLTFLSHLFFDNILNMLGVGHSQKGVPGADYLSMKLRAVVGYIVIGGGSFIFQLIIYQNDQANIKILGELNDKSEEIEKDNQELLVTKDLLNEINQNLEQIVNKKTVDVVLQNKELFKYAHINAHHVRGPLARLLGLLQLTDMDKNVDYPVFLTMVEKEVREIDDVLQELSEDLKKKKNHVSKGSI